MLVKLTPVVNVTNILWAKTSTNLKSKYKKAVSEKLEKLEKVALKNVGEIDSWVQAIMMVLESMCVCCVNEIRRRSEVFLLWILTDSNIEAAGCSEPNIL